MDLSKNNITFKGKKKKNFFLGCKFLDKLISNCVDFKEIYLHYNMINAEGGLSIIDGVRTNGTVKVVDISQNSLG